MIIDMRSIVFGGIGTVVGAAILIGRLVGSSKGIHHSGAYGNGYHAGQLAAIPIALVFAIVGVLAIRRGIQQRRRANSR